MTLFNSQNSTDVPAMLQITRSTRPQAASCLFCQQLGNQSDNVNHKDAIAVNADCTNQIKIK